MNYKNIAFKNTVEEFGKWCYHFPPLEVGVNREYFKKGSYYCSIETVSMLGVKFAGVTVRKFNDNDFIYVVNGEDMFKEEVQAYKEKYGLE